MVCCVDYWCKVQFSTVLLGTAVGYSSEVHYCTTAVLHCFTVVLGGSSVQKYSTALRYNSLVQPYITALQYSL